MSDLHFTCESLFANKESPAHYDNVLTQFFNATPLDEMTTSAFVNDKYFPNLVQCVLFPITRYALPSPSEGKPDKIVFECLHFLTHLAYINPDLLNIIAANIPFNDIIFTFFQQFNGETDVENGGGSTLVPILKFLSILSTSNEVRLENTEAIELLFHTLSPLYSIPEVSHWSVSTTCGFIHNSPTCLAFMKQTLDLLSLKTRLGAQLTSDDPSIVISALCLLTQLFPNQVTPETSIKVAISAFSGKSSPLVPFLASVIINELVEKVGITTNDVACLLKAAMNGGPMAHTIYNLLTDLGAFHEVILSTIHETNCFYMIIDTMLDDKDGFVAIAGAHFLSFFFQNKEDFIFSNEVVNQFTKAIKIILSTQKFVQLEKKEASLKLMRLMIQAQDSVTFVLSLLQSKEEDLFIDFQRQTELNNSYIALQYFLLLFESSEFLPHWKAKLIDLIAETQFSALLVHVLTESRNRDAISDALRAQYIVASALSKDTQSITSPFFDSLVSGMLLLNSHKQTERREIKMQLTNVMNQYQQKIVSLEKEKESVETELEHLHEETRQTNADLNSKLSTKKAIARENSKLKYSIKKTKGELNVVLAKLEIATNDNLQYQKKIDELKKSAVSVDAVSTSFREKVHVCSKSEQKLKKLLEKQASLQQSLKKVGRDFEIEKKETDQYKRRYDTLKKEIHQIKSRTKDIETEITKIKDDNEKINEKLNESKRKVKAHQHLQLRTQGGIVENDEIIRLREELERAKKEGEISDKQTLEKLLIVTKIQDRIAELEKENKYYDILRKVIHKSSAGYEFLPRKAESILKKRTK